MDKTITIPEELYTRLGQQVQGFETPADVIARLLDIVEGSEAGPSISSATKQEVAESSLQKHEVKPLVFGKLPINFYPEDLRVFKRELLQRRGAWVLLHMQDGSHELRQWNAHRFSESSDVLGNLRSGYLRGWREKGIVQADVAIERDDLERLV